MRLTTHMRAPTAFGFSAASSSSLGRTVDGSATLHVCEIFEVKFAGGASLFDFMLPITPSMWTGTRSEGLAKQFMSYRPVNISIKWEPVVGTVSRGTIAFGTVWAGTHLNTTTRSEASTVLTATNGGFITTIWKPQFSKIGCKTNLQQNNFPLNDIQQDDIPFWIVGASNNTLLDADTTLGYLRINGLFHVHNPASGITTVPSSSSSIRGTIVHEDASGTTAATTKLYIPTAQTMSLSPSPGEDYLFYSSTPIKNAQGTTLIKSMEPFNATFRDTIQVQEQDVYEFETDSSFVTIANVITLAVIGMAPNFITSAVSESDRRLLYSLLGRSGLPMNNNTSLASNSPADRQDSSTVPSQEIISLLNSLL